MRWNQDLFKRALDFAALHHGDQRVPGSGYPYVVHVTKVATEVLHAIGDDVSYDADLAMQCALLHDLIEDAGVTEAQLARAFSPAVAQGVRALTQDERVLKELRVADSLARIAQQPREIAVVKLADRITNLEPPPLAWPPLKVRAYRDEARHIAGALGAAHAGLAARLEQKLDAYEQFCK